jgi:hypothetical protein
MRDKLRLQQFYLRILLGFGIFWGFVPLITVFFIFRGLNDSVFDVAVVVSNSLTILPASVLAFWHRRIACVWLSLNGAMVAIAYIPRFHTFTIGPTIGILFSVLFPLCLDYIEFRHWPNALTRIDEARTAVGDSL